MGAGKSACASHVSSTLDYGIIDTDALIETQQSCSINALFDVSESHFRDCEFDLLQSLSQTQNHVISTGGGMIIEPRCQPLLQALGWVVYLEVSVQTVLDRLADNSTRPLLQRPDKEATISTLLSKRHPVYDAHSDLCIKTDTLTIAEISDIIVSKYRTLS